MFDNLRKDLKFYLISVVIFFAIGITAQIAAIKLSGGFFYVREAHVRIASNIDRGIDFLAVSGLDSFRRFLLPRVAGSGAPVFGLPPANVFVLPYIFCIVFLSLRAGAVFSKVYESGAAHIRPPTLRRI